jgi:hypothetical protein
LSLLFALFAGLRLLAALAGRLLWRLRLGDVGLSIRRLPVFAIFHTGYPSQIPSPRSYWITGKDRPAFRAHRAQCDELRRV